MYLSLTYQQRFLENMIYCIRVSSSGNDYNIAPFSHPHTDPDTCSMTKLNLESYRCIISKQNALTRREGERGG